MMEGRVRAVEVEDAVAQAGRAVLLLHGRLTLVDGIGVGVLDLARDWIDFEHLVQALVDRYGPPPGDPAELVADAVQALLDEGLVERDAGP